VSFYKSKKWEVIKKQKNWGIIQRVMYKSSQPINAHMTTPKKGNGKSLVFATQNTLK
jgi:hypothetical protein